MPDVSAGSLEYPYIEFHGNRATLGAQQYCRTERLMDTSVGGEFDSAGLVDGTGKIGADGTTLYLSFLQRISSVPSQYPYYAVELSNGDYGSGRVLLVGHDDKASPYYVARTYSNGTGSETLTPLGVENADVNLFVLKFTFDTDDDLVEIYRNPSPGGEPTTPTATLGGPGLGYDFSFHKIALARFVNTSSLLDVDEIRFGTSYADVTPVPEPCGLLLLVGGALCFIPARVARAARR